MVRNKLLLTWNIRPGNEKEHFQRIRQFVSKLSTVGLELTDAWYTIYGEAPQVLLGISVQGGQEEYLDSLLSSKDWEDLLGEIRPYIADYRQRVVTATGHFQF